MAVGARFWRVAAASAAVLLATILFFGGPGSVELVRNAPLAGGPPASALPPWTAPCLGNEYVALGSSQIAFCARTDGRVIGSATNGAGEIHLLVAGGLHLTLVELRHGTHAPSWGSRIVAVGPLTTSQGLREIHALTVVSK